MVLHVLNCTLEACIQVARAYLLNIFIFTLSRTIGVSTHLHLDFPEFFSLALTVFLNYTLACRKGILSCKRKPQLSWCPVRVYASVKDAMRLETCGRAHGCNQCQPWAVPGGTRAEQPLHSGNGRWWGRRSPAAPQRSRRFHCCHLIHFWAKQLSGQNRSPLLLPHLANVNTVTPAIEYTRSVLCGIIYLGTVSNYSRSVLIFVILMV